MDITCARCRRSYFVPDDLVHGRVFRARCSQCHHAFSVEVPERPGKKGAPKDDLKATSASAIPGLAEELEDGLGWLEEKAKEVEEDEYVLLTVRRSKRLSGVAIAAGAVVLLAAAGGIAVWIATRPKLDAPSRRARAGEEGGAAPVADVSGLAWRAPDETLPEAAGGAPAPGTAPSGETVQQAKRPRIALRDAQLLDLLGKKQDIAVLPATSDEEEGGAANAKSALDPEAAEKVVAANRRAFDTCVSRALRVNPSLKLARRATLVVTVQPSGTVSRAYLAEEEVDRTDLGLCLSDTARRMVFPSFDGEPVDVAMPLSLSAVF
ncbi:MAG TPA: AgmX/PglI C-terminal domain-containing protein [Anaeromyxobacter sp.]